MITKVENLKVGQAFTESVSQNPYAIPFSGTVATLAYPGNYVIVTTREGGWHRIHKGHTVTVHDSAIRF